MPDFAVRTAFTATDKMSPAFNKMGTAADRFASRGEMAMNKISAAKDKLMMGLGFAAGFIGISALTGLAEAGIEAASSLQEVQNVVDTTFKQQSKTIDAWSKNALDKFGLTELQAKEFASTLGSIMKPAGIGGDKLASMSMDLSGLAGEFASFRNLKIEDAFEKIRAGITGETEPLKSLGIVMTQVNLEAFALSQGIRKNWKAMSQAEQTMLRYNFIMNASKDAQGDFAKTLSTSYANQKRVFEGVKTQFMGEVMSKVLPSLTEKFAKLTARMREIDTDKFADGMMAVFTAVKYATMAFIAYKVVLAGIYIFQKAMIALDWAKYLWMMRAPILAALKAQLALNFAMYANPIGLIIAGIVALVAIGYILYRNWDAITKWFGEAWITVKAKFSAAMSAMWEGIKMLGRGIMTALLFPINLMIAGVIKLLEIASSIPGIGDKFAKAAEKVRGFQSTMNASVGATNPFAPNTAQAGNQSNVNLSGQINIAGAPKGSTATSQTQGAKPIPMKLVGQQ